MDELISCPPQKITTEEKREGSAYDAKNHTTRKSVFAERAANGERF